MKSKIIREQFLKFFESKKHKLMPSAPVIPIDDPTLLFTNAGMNQFKEIFLGLRKPEYLRVANSQKCIRAGGKHNDLEEVGKDGYHHTFFEMLGNWSFGDYYKKEAIIWAWELLTEIWKLPKERFYATVHESDQEAYELWKNETDIEENHIEFSGDEDNFWEMAATGPCGPSSEIHYDRGESFCNCEDDPDHICRVNGDCHRFIEIWNLVFIQFNKGEDGKLANLEKKYVDTGAGFERICQILQGVETNYDTDLFTPLLDGITEITGVSYPQRKYRSKSIPEQDSELRDYLGISHRVIADHIRALTFAIADGGIPSNEGRGYVLRRILRRAARHGRILNMRSPFLYKLVDVVVQEMSDYYQEIKERKAHITLIIKAEEERFNLTLDKGLAKFREIVDGRKKGKISGKEAFMLYDTFGFPLDLTRMMAQERGLEVNEDEFEKEMKGQKDRARAAAKFELKTEEIDWIEFLDTEKFEFVGYKLDSTIARIVKYSINDENIVRIVLDRTPFYAESGGQVADKGRIYNNNCNIQITDVQIVNGVFIHIGKLKSGDINDKPVSVIIDKEARLNIARNHTATHLLHKALKEVLGEHIQQKGSLVNPEHLRFDFTHYKQVKEREIKTVERIVNRVIRECLTVRTEIKTIEMAREEGAVALFGEKYGEYVRVVSVQDFSKELCGGTHVSFTGEIGLFKITGESSIAAGVRRIEAITGERSEKYVNLLEHEIDEVSRYLNAPRQSMMERLNRLLADNKKMHVQLKTYKMKSAGSILEEIIGKAPLVNGIKLVVAKVKLSKPEEMRLLGDNLRHKLGSGIAVMVSIFEDKVSLIAVVSKDLVGRFHAGKIIGEVAKIVDGSGGGRADMAMAGGRNKDKVKDALKAVKKIVIDMDKKK